MHERRFERTGSLNKPPDMLLKYVVEMGSKYSRPHIASTYPNVEHKQLFEAGYDHAISAASHAHSNANRPVRRPNCDDYSPAARCGSIVSGN